MQPVHIALVNHAAADPGVDLHRLASALHLQAARDLAPAWGLGPVAVTVEPAVPPGAWGLVLLDDADQADALGYHEVTPEGLPLGKVFVRTTIDDGQPVSVTASHELVEQLCDPDCAIAVQADDGAFYAREVADPVEDRTYRIGTVEVSDFVLPAWFESSRQPGSTRFSHLGSVSRPFELTEGGYISKYVDGSWGQVFGSHAARARFNPARKHRAGRRGRHGS